MNVHPGETLGEQIDNIGTLAPAVAAEYRKMRGLPPAYPFGLGLRFGATAAAEFVASHEAQTRLRDECTRNAMLPFTMNAFPYGRFHGSAVKEDVYRPTWADPLRVEYTANAARTLASLMPRSVACGSVSTAPLSYKTFREDPRPAAANLVRALERLRDIHENEGKFIVLAIEPEPGCYPETTDEAIDTICLVREICDEDLHDHLGICFDTAHLAVEFEDLATSIDKITSAGINIAKCQISAALECDDTPEARAALAPYAEGIYLHQTFRRMPDGDLEYFPDLPDALKSRPVPRAVMRTHFHVPLFWRGGSHLRTTAPELRDPEFIRAAHDNGCDHFEVETYTWNILQDVPGQHHDIVRGIARELVEADSIITTHH